MAPPPGPGYHWWSVRPATHPAHSNSQSEHSCRVNSQWERSSKCQLIRSILHTISQSGHCDTLSVDQINTTQWQPITTMLHKDSQSDPRSTVTAKQSPQEQCHPIWSQKHNACQTGLRSTETANQSTAFSSQSKTIQIVSSQLTPIRINSFWCKLINDWFQKIDLKVKTVPAVYYPGPCCRLNPWGLNRMGSHR